MAEAFDPYLKWLGIRDQGGPINHYRLLGLELFESDPDVIASGAARQIGHIKSFASGPHADACRRLLKELANAQSVLSDVELKTAYDLNLKKLIASLKQQPPTDRPKQAGPVVETSKFEIESPVDVSVGPNTNASNAPRIKTRPSRRKKKSSAADFVGWVLGAIGAVVFAYVLLNTDLLDRIKGIARGEMAKKESKLDDKENHVVAGDLEFKSKNGSLRNRERSNIELAPIEGKLGGPDTTTNNPDRTASRSENLNRSNPTTKTAPTKTPTQPSPVEHKKIAKAPIPTEELLKPARKQLLESYKPQINSKDLNAKRILSKSLIVAAGREEDLAKKYAMLETAIKLAGESGSLGNVIDAVDKKEQRFQIDFWESALAPAESAIKANPDFESISQNVAGLIQRSRRDGRFDLASEIAGESAKVVRKQGDPAQEELLVRFSKDMRKLESLQRSYDVIEKGDAISLSAKDNLTIGKFLCFGKGDWENGLKRLTDGSDSALASVARLDIESDGNNQLAVAEGWVNLCQKSKYKGLDRRCMFERSLELMNASDSNGTTMRQLKNQAKQQIQIVKKFTNAPLSGSVGKIVFNVRGWSTFDSAVWAPANSLRLGLGQQSRLLNLSYRNGGYFATTNDRKVSIKIRMMDCGIAEMRLYETGSNALKNIIYGK